MLREPASDWSLDPRLAGSTVAAGDLPLSRVLVNKDANYPWLILVPRRAGVSEIIDLEDGDLAQLTAEIKLVAGTLKTMTQCDKLNIAALGNVVRQLHVHIIARFLNDAAGQGPVWDVLPPLAYDDEKLRDFVTRLRRQIGLGDGGLVLAAVIKS